MSEAESASEQSSTDQIRYVDDPRAYATAARQAPAQRVVWVPRSVRSKETLLRLLADALHFPRYFRRNWDAFEECLRVFIDQLPEQGALVIVHEQSPFTSGDNRQTYLDILRSAGQDRTDGRRLIAVFRSGH